jgi:hypothetical protein
MRAMSDCSAAENEGLILHAQDENDLALIRLPHVQAVVYSPPSSPWLTELAEAVRRGAFATPGEARAFIPDSSSGNPNRARDPSSLRSSG